MILALLGSGPMPWITPMSPGSPTFGLAEVLVDHKAEMPSNFILAVQDILTEHTVTMHQLMLTMFVLFVKAFFKWEDLLQHLRQKL